MKQIRKRLTYANVMSSIAVFLVLGGATAFAASQLGKNSVGSKQLKKNSVTAAKIKKDAVTGAKIKNGTITGGKIQDGTITGGKINTATVGKVPSATSADNVGGNTISAINFSGDPAIAKTVVLNLDGFTLTAACPSSGGLTVVANGPTGSRVHTVALETNGAGVVNSETRDSLEPNDNVPLLSDDNDLVNGHTEFSGGAGGRNVSVIWEAESFPIPSGPDCTFTGYAIG